ncbi:hypothetical protein GCM10009865_12620 [Aeromicrobium ponti]|uniref:Membrane protein YqhR n=1 Tax=Cytobacillus oceanisediminis TaxID=665099 RepID=A0A562K385_9BACI|nr:hypothetical protein [Cytobacillus oceanisediminis]TWH89891.1 hypothetical protein IQ19_01146 [Cytobacillus oceanisediminis]
MGEKLAKGIIAGGMSGIFLGLFLKIIEVITEVKVYVLLLNVDYIPLLKEFSFPEPLEFLLHLIISVIVAAALFSIIKKYQWTQKQIIFRTIFISFLIGVLLYPTTVLSDRTPELTSVSALSFWLLGHLLYGWILTLFFIKKGPSR